MAQKQFLEELLNPCQDKFAKATLQLIDTALSSGIRNTPLRAQPPESAFMGHQHQRRFLTGCHRGYDRAQETLVKALGALQVATHLDSAEIAFRRSVFRRVADAIAVAMLNMKDHVIARMCLEFAIHPLDMQVLTAAYEEVKRMNAESRKTFALLADMTTFVHVCDVLRIDFRPGSPLVQMIELKSGRINEILLKDLADYQPVPESLDQIDDDPAIDDRYRSQAKRMMRQKVRLAQVEEILETDEGTDPVSGQLLKLSKDLILLEGIGTSIEQACQVALDTGAASTTLDDCIHVGSGYSDSYQEAKAIASDALDVSVDRHYVLGPDSLRSTMEEIRKIVPEDELVVVVDPLQMNLRSVPTRPFPVWGIKRSTVGHLLGRRLVILFGFDLSSFFWMCRSKGVDVHLSTRKESARRDQLLGGKGNLTWGNRIVVLESCDGPVQIGERNWLRFLCDWISPADFVGQAWVPWTKQSLH